MILASAPASVLAQQAQPPAHPAIRPKPPQPQPATTAPATPEVDDTPLPGDWAPELLDGILSSPNPEARDTLLDAAFAAGPAIVPQLEAALKDDRTAEFAAQSLAFLGGPKALEILAKLMSDPRDLGLRRFYYGALGEFRAVEATKVLFYALGQADQEPDRTVTESAIIALTVRSDASLIPELRQAEGTIKDLVLRDDLDNAIQVIGARARYLASPQGRKSGGSVDEAVRTYFAPALESSSPSQPSVKPAVSKAGVKTAAPGAAAHTPASPPQPRVKVEIRHLTLSPDGSRALARVSFEDPSTVAYYSIVLQKQAGDWTVASVWLGSEQEKPGVKVEAAPSPDAK